MRAAQGRSTSPPSGVGNALGKVLHNLDANENVYPALPYWLIVDDRFRCKYRYFTGRPDLPDLPDPTWCVKAGMTFG